MSFWCAKRKEKLDEPCSDCEDCPGDDVAVLHLATFMTLDEERVTPEVEADLAAQGWVRV